MMELTCAVLLLSASLVSATPYGYGVKGGASARAESSATAGAFGGVGEIPVAVPLGAGYSGSFSKSSSSSSSASSASSSSSSSSFSYSGSGAGGFGLNSEAHGNGGCSSGTCQNAGGNGISTTHGSSLGHNAANAAATAGAAAGAVSGPGCHGLSCDRNPEKCTSGQCKPKSPTGSTSTDSDTKKCSSGQCGSALEGGISSANYGSNDIRVVSDSGHNSKDQSTSFDKTSTAHNGANSDCSHGNCNPSGPVSSKPDYYGHGSGNSNQGFSATNLEQSSSSDAGATSHYQKPSTHLETPKLSSNCNSGNCNAEPVGPSGSHETLPSSYNVPIHGAYNTGEQKPNCDGVKCGNQPKGPYSSTNSNTLTTNYQQQSPSADNYVTKGPLSFNSPSSNCVGSSCYGSPTNQNTGASTLSPYHTNAANAVGTNGGPGHIGHDKPSDINKSSNDKLPAYTGGFGGPAGVLNPNEFDVPAPTGNPSHAHATTSQNGKPSGTFSTGCNSPSCSGYPSSSVPSIHTGSYSHKPSGAASSEKLPTYTGGFGGPTGMLKPNEFDIHATVTDKPNYAHPASSSYGTQSPSNNIGTTGCKSGNCGAYSPTAGSSGTTSLEYFGTTKPSTGISPNEKLPTYTGGFGGPEGVFNPNKYDTHQTSPTSPGHSPSGTYNHPTSGGCATPNCYPSLGSTAAANAQAESFGVTKPSSGPHLSSVTLPSYTSGYGSPSGVSRPNEISAPASVPNYAHTQPQSGPGSYSTGCKTGNCAVYPDGGSSVDVNTQPGSFGNTKPTYVNPPSPQYTGGFDGPSGSVKPSQNTYVTPSAGSAPVSCKTPNCASSPTATSGSISGANTQSGVHAQSGANSQSGSYGITKPSSGPHLSSVTLPSYTSGYGSPSGVSRPNEINAPASIPSYAHTQPQSGPGSYSTGCKTGNCAVYPDGGSSVDVNTQPGSFGNTKPTYVNPSSPQYTSGFDGPSGTLKPSQNTYVTPSAGSVPVSCKTPNCASSPTATGGSISGANTQSGVHAQSGANSQSGSSGITKPSGPTYTGGFGGAPGILNPSEYSIPSVGIIPNKPTDHSKPAVCTSGNCNPQVPHGSSSHSHNDASNAAHATATAAADANAIAYTGGFGGPPGVLEPYDGGKDGVKPVASGGQAHGSQAGGAHYGSHNTHIHSAYGTVPGANSGTTGPAGPAGAHGSGAHAGSVVGSAAHAGAAAGSLAGSHGYNTHGSHYNQAGNIKGGSPCGGGCGGTSGGDYNGGSAHNSGSSFDFSGGLSSLKLGYSDGATGGGNTSSAAAKSLAGANAFGVGGSFASSSASAHASAGAYTKGGYGK